MANAKHAPHSRQHFSKRKASKPVLVLVAFVLLLTISIGSTLAYISVKSEKIETVFVPTDVQCMVQDNLTVKNTGSNNAYIRVAAVPNYMNADGHICAEHGTLSSPAAGEGWVYVNGYYYYSQILSPDTVTSPVFVFTGNQAEDGCSLRLELFASAIQAEPADVVIKVWEYSPVGSN